MLSNDRLRFASRAAQQTYRQHIGVHGSPVERERRGEQWLADNHDLWTVTPLEPDPNAAAKARWSYRTNEIKPPPVNPVDSRPASEGYDHFDFNHQHPALRR